MAGSRVGGILLVTLFALRSSQAAELSVLSMSMPAGSVATLVVHGSIDGESTFGVTILTELIPRPGTSGSLQFTPAPPVDIVQLGDPWPGVGLFTAFDTDPVGGISLLQNGSVDSSAAGAAPVTFSDPLSGFPMIASADASGTWDVILTSPFESNWEGLATTLIAGTVTVEPAGCTVDADCDDGLFCNGREVCDEASCMAGSAPCVEEICDEELNFCICTMIAASDPPNCAIDARQPSKPDGTDVAGWTQIDLVFDPPSCDAAMLPESGFVVREMPADVPLDIATVSALGNRVTIVLPSIVSLESWTCFSHLDTLGEACLGYLPGDVNSDRTSNPALDLGSLIDCVNNPGTCLEWQANTDRIGTDPGVLDITRLIDLFNGAGIYESWTGALLSACPSE